MERGVQCRGTVTPERFWLAVAIFHSFVLAGSWHVACVWRDPLRCGRPLGPWLTTLAHDVGGLAIVTYLVSLLATVVANIGYDQTRVHVGPITLRLLGQAIFIEGSLLGMALAYRHRGARHVLRAAILAVAAVVVFAINVDAYYVEPRMVRLRHHSVPASGDSANTRALRILHVSDIQTPAIGAHEELALAAGLSQRPDLIVLTGDYVQNAWEWPRRSRPQATYAADPPSAIRRASRCVRDRR